MSSCGKPSQTVLTVSRWRLLSMRRSSVVMEVRKQIPVYFYKYLSPPISSLLSSDLCVFLHKIVLSQRCYHYHGLSRGHEFSS